MPGSKTTIYFLWFSISQATFHLAFEIYAHFLVGQSFPSLVADLLPVGLVAFGAIGLLKWSWGPGILCGGWGLNSVSTTDLGFGGTINTCREKRHHFLLNLSNFSACYSQSPLSPFSFRRAFALGTNNAKIGSIGYGCLGQYRSSSAHWQA